jgi:hypothetical protein
MDCSDLILRVQWYWGGSTIVRTPSSSSIGDALSIHGFAAFDRSIVVVAHRGRLVDPLFTFHHYNVRSGDRLVCLSKRLPSKDKSNRFLSSLCAPPRRPVEAPRPDLTDADRTAEVARLNDFTYLASESAPELVGIARDLLRQQDEQASERNDIRIPTVLRLDAAPKISDAPLPCCFRREDVANAVWKKYWLVPEQQPRGGHFDGLRKR